MDETKTPQPNVKKSILSIILLLALLMGLFYVAPIMTEKFREYEANEEAAAGNELVQPQTSSELKSWLPLVTRQFPMHEDGSAKFTLLHMRLNEEKSELLLDIKEGEKGKSFDLILKRDQFDRYVSGAGDFTIKLYPPED